MTGVPGQKLLDAAAACQREVTLIAPFIKENALRRVLSKIKPEIPVKVVARWIPAEIVSGVCDLEIFDLLQQRSRAELRLHQLLHAKLYRFDDLLLFGSANLTWKACGWASPSNWELLHSESNLNPLLKQFEVDVIERSILVDRSYRDLVQSQVDLLKETSPSLMKVFEDREENLRSDWLPTSEPLRLWQVYSEGEAAQRRVVSSQYDAATSDLDVLGIEPGLTFSQFCNCVSAALERMPVVRQVDELAHKGLSDEAAVSLISSEATSRLGNYDAAQLWDVLRSWLTFFFPQRYLREQTSEVLRVGRVIQTSRS